MPAAGRSGSARSGSARTARPKHAPGAARTPFALLMLGLVGGGMAALLALNTASAANEVRRHDLADSDQGVAASLVQLQNQVRSSAAPDNLAAAAAALGMVPAGNPAFLEIDKSGRVRVLGSPAPASAVPVYVAPKPTTAKPTPKPTASKTKNGSKTKTKTNSTTRTASRTASTTSSPKPGASSTKAPKPKPKPKPKPTPTPTISLGGDR